MEKLCIEVPLLEAGVLSGGPETIDWSLLENLSIQVVEPECRGWGVLMNLGVLVGVYWRT